MARAQPKDLVSFRRSVRCAIGPPNQNEVRRCCAKKISCSPRDMPHRSFDFGSEERSDYTHVPLACAQDDGISR
jgi:hypothetical protein